MTGRERYDNVAIALHWVIALGVLALCVIGLSMIHLKIPMALQFRLYQLHKSIGITVLLAVVLRILWRLTHRPPPLPATLPPLERKAAGGAHGVLYALMLAMPLTGWALVSVSVLNLPTVLYGVLPWPDLPVLPNLHNKAPVEATMTFIHDKLAWSIIVVIVLHTGAALRHQFILRDGVMRRMLPFARTKGLSK